MTRRFPLLRPGDVRRCPNGCPERAPGQTDFSVMPDFVPENGRGYWQACCLYCGWCAFYRVRYGDRAHDIAFVVDEDVPPEQRALLRVRILSMRLDSGLGPWPPAVALGWDREDGGKER